MSASAPSPAASSSVGSAPRSLEGSRGRGAFGADAGAPWSRQARPTNRLDRRIGSTDESAPPTHRLTDEDSTDESAPPTNRLDRRMVLDHCRAGGPGANVTTVVLDADANAGTVTEFLDRLAARSPTPAGGSVAALCTAQAAALVAMVARYCEATSAGRARRAARHPGPAARRGGRAGVRGGGRRLGASPRRGVRRARTPARRSPTPCSGRPSRRHGSSRSRSTCSS